VQRKIQQQDSAAVDLALEFKASSEELSYSSTRTRHQFFSHSKRFTFTIFVLLLGKKQ
jgi:hypothetical protein